MKQNENLSIESRVVSRGRTDGRTDRHTHMGMTKLIVAFRNFVNAQNKYQVDLGCNRDIYLLS